jgi:hypothetical protein
MDDHKLIEHLVRWAVIAAIGAGSGMATRQVGDAEHNAVVQSNRSEVLALQADIRMIREGFAQRVEVEEKEREDALKRIERRLTWLEAKLDISAPPAAAMPAEEPTR